MKLIIITGTNRGLGEAIFNAIKDVEDMYIWCISRRLSKEQAENMESYPRVTFFLQDLAVLEDINFLNFDTIKPEVNEIVFINNAASIQPIGSIGSFENTQIRTLINLNTTIPLQMINEIVKCKKDRSVKVINISSGAARSPIVGWSLYCTTKCANEMFLNVLEKQEGTKEQVLVYNIDPGVIDTAMQQNIRNTAASEFPNVSDFIKLKERNILQDAKDVALRILNECKIL